MAFGGEQSHLRSLALEEGVGRDRGAVDDALGPFEQRPAVETHGLGQTREALEDAERLIGGGRGSLGVEEATLFVDRDEIGEGAADVDADADHGSVSPPSLV